jgi:hypothetical protein
MRMAFVAKNKEPMCDTQQRLDHLCYYGRSWFVNPNRWNREHLYGVTKVSIDCQRPALSESPLPPCSSGLTGYLVCEGMGPYVVSSG